MADLDTMSVKVIYAEPHKAWVVSLTLPTGTLVREAVEQALATGDLPAIDMTNMKLGMFGRKIKPDAVLADGERVEILRALTLDPKEARRRRAQRKSSV